MSYEDFMALVAKMRRKQTEYFTTRRPDVLRDAQRLEREVDKALEGTGRLFWEQEKTT